MSSRAKRSGARRSIRLLRRLCLLAMTDRKDLRACHRERTKWSAAIYKIASSALPPRNDRQERSPSMSSRAKRSGARRSIRLLRRLCLLAMTDGKGLLAMTDRKDLRACHRERTKWSAAIYKIASSALPPRNDRRERASRNDSQERPSRNDRQERPFRNDI